MDNRDFTLNELCFALRLPMGDVVKVLDKLDILPTDYYGFEPVYTIDDFDKVMSERRVYHFNKHMEAKAKSQVEMHWETKLIEQEFIQDKTVN